MRVQKFHFLSVIVGIVVGVVAFAAPVLASAGPEATVKATVEKVRSIVSEKEGKVASEALDKELKDVVTEAFDFDEMSRRCLGKNWKQATPEQRKEFVSLFSDLLAKNYLKKIRENITKSDIKYHAEKITDKKAELKTSVKYGEEDAIIEYRLREKSDGWRVYDVVIENVGLVTNYRNEFSGIVRKDGIEGLLKKLKEKK